MCPFVNVNLFFLIQCLDVTAVCLAAVLSSESRSGNCRCEKQQSSRLKSCKMCVCEIKKGREGVKNNTQREVGFCRAAYGWQVVLSGVMVHTVTLFPRSCNNSGGVIPTCQERFLSRHFLHSA